ncbi:MAG TPA: nucleotide exchange factor GrpE [Nannocystaceae bacterium]|nr:nucleotide exchange factor GrpE [Nannocystaceae bacterium]
MNSSKDPAPDDDLSDEIRRTMAEAEAAVSALEEGERQERHPTGERRAVGGDDDDDAGAPQATRDVPSGLAAAMVELESELDATKDKWLRAVADLENYKKRVKRETEDAVTRAIQSLLPSFLPTVDNLDRALEVASPDSKIEQVVKGIQMVRDEFMGALRKHGIEPVESIGVPFDPSVHDALQQVDSPDHPPGMVIREFERGYKLGDRLLRPARVIIAGPGSTGKA